MSVLTTVREICFQLWVCQTVVYQRHCHISITSPQALSLDQAKREMLFDRVMSPKRFR